MEELLLFLLTYILTFIFYQIFVVRRAKKERDSSNKKKKKKEYKEVLEISYLVYRYHIDLDKISYSQLLQIIALVSSFDIAVVVSVILLMPNLLLELLVGISTMVLLIIISYHFVYLFYKKKGMIKDE